MQGCLSFRNGVLYVGRHARTAHVRPYDLDGAPLGPGFRFAGPTDDPTRPTFVGGLDVDGEHQVWVADGGCDRVRVFNLFGTEVGGLSADSGTDRAGGLARVVDLCVREDDERGSEVLVACGGRRRHAVQVFAPDGALRASLRPLGDPEGRFAGVRGLAEEGPWTCVAEGWERRVQVFRERDFHFEFRLDVAGQARFEPNAAVPLPDGRFVVAQGGGSERTGPDGRRRPVVAGPGARRARHRRGPRAERRGRRAARTRSGHALGRDRPRRRARPGVHARRRVLRSLRELAGRERVRPRTVVLAGLLVTACAAVVLAKRWITDRSPAAVRGSSIDARADGAASPVPLGGGPDARPSSSAEASARPAESERDVLTSSAPSASEPAAPPWRGRVLDGRTGQPLDGVTVALRSGGAYSEAESDADGLFVVPWNGARPTDAEFRGDGYATAPRPAIDPRAERDWELWPTAAIRGVVRGPGARQGDPVEVVLWSENGPTDSAPELQITTVDDDGLFAFDVEPGVYALAAHAPRAAAVTRAGLGVRKAQAVDVELELPRGARLDGRVLARATRGPVEGARVTLAWTGGGLPAAVEERLQRSATTGRGGRFHVEGLAAGRQLATIEAPDGVVARDPFAIAETDVRLEREFFVGASALIAGTVRAPTGAAIEAARVVVFDADRIAELAAPNPTGLARCTTQRDGSFELVDLPPGERLVLVALPPPESEWLASEPRPTDLRSDQERRDFDLELCAGAAISGQVADLDGRPLPGARLELVRRSKVGDWDDTSVLADEHGAFEFPPLAAGRATLSASADGHAPDSTKVTLGDGEELVESFSLRPATAVDGTVVDMQGWGVPWVPVRLKRHGPVPAGSKRREVLRTSTDAFGVFRFDAVPDGGWRADAQLSGWSLDSVTPETLSLPADRAVTLVLARDFRRSVRIHGEVTVAGETPYDLRLEGVPGLTVVDGGEFSISGMAPGRAKLVVRADRALPRVVPLDLAAGGEIDVGVIELLRGTELEVRLRDPGGRPVRRAAVRLEPHKPPPKSRRGRYGVPAPTALNERKSGRYGGVPVRPGRWRVIVEAKGFASTEEAVRVRDRARQVVSIDLRR